MTGVVIKAAKQDAGKVPTNTDRFFTVPNGKTIEVIQVKAILNTSALAGFREVIFEVVDKNDDVLFSTPNVITHMLNTNITYLFSQNIQNGTVVESNGTIAVNLPTNFFITPGNKVRIYDRNQVDPLGDFMLVFVSQIENVV